MLQIKKITSENIQSGGAHKLPLHSLPYSRIINALYQQLLFKELYNGRVYETPQPFWLHLNYYIIKS